VRSPQGLSPWMRVARERKYLLDYEHSKGCTAFSMVSL
jgi:hypothetical protein